jgi:hypothetical protein
VIDEVGYIPFEHDADNLFLLLVSPARCDVQARWSRLCDDTI